MTAGGPVPAQREAWVVGFAGSAGGSVFLTPTYDDEDEVDEIGKARAVRSGSCP